ncbi:PAS domain S-box protein [Streptomyces sp. F001]|nr:PAS domain S-box protein [Streptomyces sp. F001]
MENSAHTAITRDQMAFQTAGAAIALLDAKGTVVGWTQAAQRLIGCTAAEVVGRSAAALLATDDDRAKAAVLATAHAPSRRSAFTTVRHRDGHGIDVRLWAQPLSGQDGQTRWIVSATDATTQASWPTDGPTMPPLPAAPQIPGSVPIGVVVRDTQLRCTWVNETQGARDGIPLQQRLGRRLTQAAPGPQAETLEALMRQVLESGAQTTHVEFQALARAHTRREPTFMASLFRLDDAAGRALGVCVVSVDVTASRRAHERLAILGQAGKRIGTTLDVMRTGQELADLAVPLLAEYATVDLAETVPLGTEPLTHPGPRRGRIPTFRRAGYASVHQGAAEALFAPGEPVLVPPVSSITQVLQSGKSHLEPQVDASCGTWADRPDTARAQKVRDHAMHSLMVVPIHARGDTLGVAMFMRAEERGPFEEDDLLLAEELVSRAALSLDNARQYARERSAALALQRHLLPHHASGGSAADVAWRYLPADSHHGVGGDWFDVIPLSGARLALVVGDVVGHGINAAATMGQLRTAVRTLANLDLPPEEVLAHLDDTITRLTEEDADPQDPGATMTATCLYAVYDPITRQCTMVRAGHPPPAIVDPQGGVTFPDLPTGAPLGVGLVPFESVTLELPEGSILALYTDGLIEACDRDISAGMNRLGTALARPGLPLEDLCSSAVDALPAKAWCDDVTLLLAQTHSLGPNQVASWEFPADPAIVSNARSFATAQLARWGLQHHAPATELIVSELVTNAVRHGTGPVHLRLIRHHALTCEVHDTSNSTPRRRHPHITDDNGRGLLLVDELSRRWGTRHTPNGKLTWAEQCLTPKNAPTL